MTPVVPSVSTPMATSICAVKANLTLVDVVRKSEIYCRYVLPPWNKNIHL